MTSNASMCLPLIYAVNSSMCHVLPSDVLAVSLTINMLLGLPANSYVLWLSMKEMIQGQSTEIFNCNVALVEVIFCFSYVFLVWKFFFSCSNCDFGLLFLGLILWVGRPLFQSCICLERYLGVLYPVTFLKFKHIKYRIAFSIAGWTVIMSSCLIYALEANALFNILLIEMVFFLVVKLFCCLMLLKALLRPRPGDEVKQVNKNIMKAFRVTQIVLVGSVIVYGPNIISLVLYYIIDQEQFLMSLSISLCLGLMLGIAQPLIYLKRVGKLPFCSKKA